MKSNSKLIQEIPVPYCNYDICARLKEIGFDVPTQNFWEESLTEQYDDEDGYSGPFGWEKGEINFRNGYTVNSLIPSNKYWYICSAPDINTVVDWIRLNYNIWISVEYILSVGKYKAYINSMTNEEISIPDLDLYYDPQSATASAIRYVLDILI